MSVFRYHEGPDGYMCLEDLWCDTSGVYDTKGVKWAEPVRPVKGHASQRALLREAWLERLCSIHKPERMADWRFETPGSLENNVPPRCYEFADAPKEPPEWLD